MKKLKNVLTCVLASALCIGAAACLKEKKDVSAPEIFGIKTIKTVIFENCNLLEGVTAKDDKDGDVTSSLKVVVLPIAFSGRTKKIK